MNLAFACSLRMGEILGLTWKNVHIEDENIATDNAYIYIEAELARASKQAIETLGEKDIYHIFTPLMPNTSTPDNPEKNQRQIPASVRSGCLRQLPISKEAIFISKDIVSVRFQLAKYKFQLINIH